jgi:hypothetical protein
MMTEADRFQKEVVVAKVLHLHEMKRRTEVTKMFNQSRRLQGSQDKNGEDEKVLHNYN